jgi:hypothetical protein
VTAHIQVYTARTVIRDVQLSPGSVWVQHITCYDDRGNVTLDMLIHSHAGSTPFPPAGDYKAPAIIEVPYEHLQS